MGAGIENRITYDPDEITRLLENQLDKLKVFPQSSGRELHKSGRPLGEGHSEPPERPLYPGGLRRVQEGEILSDQCPSRRGRDTCQCDAGDRDPEPDHLWPSFQ